LSFLQQALVLVRSHDADIIIMHVHPTGTMDAAVPGAIQMNSELAEHRLTDLKEALDYPAEKIFLVIETGVVATHILKCVRMMSVDLVVMGAHMRGTAHKLLIGSATKGVLQKTDVPILVIPQKD
jgi:nucleotide-binding universal stress UspA family protein